MRLHPCVLLLLAASPAMADAPAPTPQAATPLAPWSDERAVIAHLDQATLRGTLDGDALSDLVAAGERLFRARFAEPDGAGRPMATQAIIPTKRRRPAPQAYARLPGPDAAACAGCHNQPILGGAGDFVANVFVSEGFGDADFDATDPQFSNERNSNHLFGAGLVELLAREMTAELHAARAAVLRDARVAGAARTMDLRAKGVEFGRLTATPDGLLDLSGVEGVDPDLVIRPFGHKGVMTSLRQFTVNALNHHHGMQAEERFGARWTGEDDFDGDGHAAEITAGDVSALTAWQATLPPPVIAKPDDPAWAEAAALGSDAFDALGCASCHVRALPLESLRFADPGPHDAAGTLRAGELAQGAVYDLGLREWAARLPRDEQGRALVPLFGDLKRHVIADAQVAVFGDELIAQRFVPRDQFATTELWGVADTGPWGHRGDLGTLDAAIRGHGGAGRLARDAYVAAPQQTRDALIAFLKTLRIAP